MSGWKSAVVALSEFWDMGGAKGRLRYFQARGIPVGDDRYYLEMTWDELNKQYIYRWRLKDS